MIKLISNGSPSSSYKFETLVELCSPPRILDNFSSLKQLEIQMLSWLNRKSVSKPHVLYNYFGDRNTASLTRYIKQQKCTANCRRTVNTVYKLKIFGNGLCFDKVFKGLDRDINKKQMASRIPCNVACASLNFTPSK